MTIFNLLVKSEGGWAAFSRILISEDDTEEEEMAETSTLPLNSNQSITMSQLEVIFILLTLGTPLRTKFCTKLKKYINLLPFHLPPFFLLFIK